jgi:RES domain-containing protein
MRIHRLVKARQADTALDGEGARRVGGRWNPPGVPVAYDSSSLSLAVLELLVHVDPCDVPDDLVAVQFEFPDGMALSRLLPADLPDDWRQDRGRAALQSLGARWIQAREAGILIVPSVIVPAEVNVLVNPVHPDAARVKVVFQEPFHLDPRLR